MHYTNSAIKKNMVEHTEALILPRSCGSNLLQEYHVKRALPATS